LWVVFLIRDFEGFNLCYARCFNPRFGVLSIGTASIRLPLVLPSTEPSTWVVAYAN